jgi:hypothetical protein
MVTGFFWQHRFFICANHNSSWTLQACSEPPGAIRMRAREWDDRRRALIQQDPHFPSFPGPSSVRFLSIVLPFHFRSVLSNTSQFAHFARLAPEGQQSPVV